MQSGTFNLRRLVIVASFTAICAFTLIGLSVLTIRPGERKFPAPSWVRDAAINRVPGLTITRVNPIRITTKRHGFWMASIKMVQHGTFTSWILVRSIPNPEISRCPDRQSSNLYLISDTTHKFIRVDRWVSGRVAPVSSSRPRRFRLLNRSLEDEIPATRTSSATASGVLGSEP